MYPMPAISDEAKLPEDRLFVRCDPPTEVKVGFAVHVSGIQVLRRPSNNDRFMVEDLP